MITAENLRTLKEQIELERTIKALKFIEQNPCEGFTFINNNLKTHFKCVAYLKELTPMFRNIRNKGIKFDRKMLASLMRDLGYVVEFSNSSNPDNERIFIELKD